MKHDLAALASTIETAFDARDTVSTSTRGEVRDAVETALNLLDSGQARVADRGGDGEWTVNQWLKKAVLLSFRLNPMETITGGPGAARGGTRFRRNSTAGARRNSKQRAFAQCPTVSSAGQPMWPGA
jgi:2,3,4,5-tetrahydropyridine-2,6-dicarboxylate N-succinyltransferase